MKRQFQAKYCFSTLDNFKFPRNFEEVAILGRSNVGKSSLINHLVQSQVAKISSKPGKTITINLFSIDQSFYLVDLPGYGYAKVNKQLKTSWSSAIDTYLNESAKLSLLIQLIDARHPPSKQDLEMLAWIESKKIPTIIVLTKVDKLKKMEQKNIISSFQNFFQKETFCTILPYSIFDNRSRIILRQEIDKYIGKRKWD